MAIFLIDLIPLMVAVAAFLMMAAGFIFYQPLKRIADDLPFPLNILADAITGGIGKAINALVRQWDTLMVPLAHALMMVAGPIWRFAYQVVTNIADLSAKLAHLSQEAATDAANAGAAAEAYALGLANGLAGEIASVEGELHGLEQGLVGDINALVGVALIPIEGAISDVQSEANRLFGAAETDIANGVASAEAFAQGLADSVQSEAVRLFGQAEDAIGTIEQEIVALPGQIEGVIPGVVEGLVPGIIAGAIPGILAQVLPRVTTLETEVAECLEPLCDTVTPQAPRLGNLGKLFQELEDLGIEALIIALAAECLTDPGAVAHDITGVFNDVGAPIMAGFRDLIGA
jgi:hypothetical protein